MSVTVVVGCQYGSESKGKITAHIAKTDNAKLCIRTGGMNAGHTCYPNGQKYITRQLPSALAVPGIMLAIGAGGMIDMDLLGKELSTLGNMGWPVSDRLMIDPFAAIVDEDAKHMESEILGLTKDIGSTGTGTGWTQSQRILRKGMVAKDIVGLETLLGDVTLMANRLANSGLVIVEGTQGFGLSMLHGGCYPFCTSRDTSVSGFLSEAGLAPSLCDRVIMVVRSYPIRVGGNSGPMFNEIDWATVQKESGYPNDLTEMTSVTKKVRRVGRFDWRLLNRACVVNRPTDIALHGADYLDFADYGKTNFRELSERTQAMVMQIEQDTGVPVTFIFTGPRQEHLIDRRYHGMRPKPGQLWLHEQCATEGQPSTAKIGEDWSDA